MKVLTLVLATTYIALASARSDSCWWSWWCGCGNHHDYSMDSRLESRQILEQLMMKKAIYKISKWDPSGTEKDITCSEFYFDFITHYFNYTYLDEESTRVEASGPFLFQQGYGYPFLFLEELEFYKHGLENGIFRAHNGYVRMYPYLVTPEVIVLKTCADYTWHYETSTYIMTAGDLDPSIDAQCAADALELHAGTSDTLYDPAACTGDGDFLKNKVADLYPAVEG